MIDSERFPSLADYIARLPDGLASYPECQSKGSLLLSAVLDQDLDEITEGLPPVLVNVMRAPPPAGVWVSAVLSDAAFHAVCDRVYATDDAMLAWCRERTMMMATNPLYRAFFRVSGPRVLFKMSMHSHRLFQRGTDLEIETLEPNRVVSRMTHPPHLHSRLNQLSNVSLFEAIAELTGGKNVKATMLERGPTEALYECTWQ
ncbi:MAG: hypothetical protein AAF645_10120 [Myxococcota bacterium]